MKDVAVTIGMTSIHLEGESMTSKNIFPSMGPAKSMCSLDHGRVGHLQGWAVVQLGSVDSRCSVSQHLLCPDPEVATIATHGQGPSCATSLGALHSIHPVNFSCPVEG